MMAIRKHVPFGQEQEAILMKTLNKEMIHSGGLFLLSIVTAYFFYTSISLPLLGQLYLIDSEGKMLCLYLSHIVFFYLLFKVVLQLRVFQPEKGMALIVYVLLMYAAFFDRAGYDVIRRSNLDPFALFAYNNMETIMLNIAIFLPFHTVLHWVLPNRRKAFYIALTLFVAVGVEVVQIISGKGMFDLVDLNLYLIGYFCGYLLYERLLRSGVNA